jgi:hypothetical protein
MEQVRSPEAKVNFYQITRRHIPKYCYVYGVTVDGVWIDGWICWTLTDRNYM